MNIYEIEIETKNGDMFKRVVHAPSIDSAVKAARAIVSRSAGTVGTVRELGRGKKDDG